MTAILLVLKMKINIASAIAIGDSAIKITIAHRGMGLIFLIRSFV